ncbi:MAG: MFS transporter [Dehalococcoidia bacterium]|nr:MAG: MFS transporter [Dehalococcoidia bacterium]
MPSLRTFSSLRLPSFRYYLGMYWCGMAVQDMRTVAQSLLIYRLTGSVALLGVMALVNTLPSIVLPLAGGVIADRLPKKNTIILGQMGTLFTLMIIAVSLGFGFMSAERAGSWWILMVASFISHAFAGLVGASRQAIVTDLVGTDQIMNAISLRTLGYNVLHMGAPALAGVLIDALDFAWVYYLMSAITVIAIIFTLFMPFSGSAAAQLVDGLKYVRSERNILFLLLFTLISITLTRPYIRLMPVFVDDILEVGATGMGVLLSVSAIGALVSSLVMASLPSKRRGAMLLIASIVLGLALVVFAFSRSWYLSLVVIIFVGMGQSARATLGNTLLQAYTAPNYRGRVMSLYGMEEGTASLGVFVAAMLAEVYGVPWTVGGFAIVVILLALLALAFLPRMRKLD